MFFEWNRKPGEIWILLYNIFYTPKWLLLFLWLWLNHSFLCWRNLRGVVANMLGCDTVVSEFKLQLCHYIHFRANTLGKDMKPILCHIPTSYNRIIRLFLITQRRESPRCVVTILTCNMEANQLKSQSCYYVHFRTNTVGKCMNSLITPVTD